MDRISGRALLGTEMVSLTAFLFCSIFSVMVSFLCRFFLPGVPMVDNNSPHPNEEAKHL